MDRIQATVERIVRTWRALMARLRKSSWRWWAAVTAVLLVVQEIVLALVPGVTFSILRVVGQAVIWFGGRPMWFGGVVVLFYVLVLVGLSFVEESPTLKRLWARNEEPVAPVAPEPAEPPPLSAQDYQNKDTLRMFWRTHVVNAITYMRALFFEIKEELRNRHHRMALLLHYPHNELEQSFQRMQSAIGDNSQTSFGDAIAHFEQVVEDYMHVVRWVHVALEEVDPSLGKQEEVRRQLLKWTPAHEQFTRQFHEFINRAHFGDLRWCFDNRVVGCERFVQLPPQDPVTP